MSQTSGQQDQQRDGAQVSNFNLPNALTTLRIVMVPFFGWALLTQDGQSVGWRWIAWVLFAVAMITDKIDGDLARARGLVTDFGKIADPIADKAMTGMAFIGLSIIHPLFPAWLWWVITVVVLVREWGVTLARLSVARQVVMPANRSGKVKTMTQALALGGLVAPFGMLSGGWHTPGLVVWWLFALLLAVSVVLTVTSGLEFSRELVKQKRGEPAATG